LKAIDEHVREELKNRPEQKRDWRTYKQMDVERIRDAIKSLDPFVSFILSYSLWIADVYFSYTFVVKKFYDFSS